jgi:nitrite reductase (NO-forming)
MRSRGMSIGGVLLGTLFLLSPGVVCGEEPIVEAVLTYAPAVPPPIARRAPALLRVGLEAIEMTGVLMKNTPNDTTYGFWTFNGHVPGPFIRARVGDTLEIRLKNPSASHMPHNIDLHGATGPGGGAALTQTNPGEIKTARFKLLYPGLFVYHCAAQPMSMHIANGMYGALLVEPAEGLPTADREFYVMQQEIYTTGAWESSGLQDYDRKKALEERPTFVIFNGRVGALMGDGALQAKVGDHIRIYFADAGPDLTSSLHIVGAVMEQVFPDGSMKDVEHNRQTVSIAPGDAAIVEFHAQVPGDYTLMDHDMAHMDKGAAGTIRVKGPEQPEIYKSVQ